MSLNVATTVGPDKWTTVDYVRFGLQSSIEYMWFGVIMGVGSTLGRALYTATPRVRQPYILALVSAGLFGLALLMDGITISILKDGSKTRGNAYIVLASIIWPLWQQPILLFTMAAIWVLRNRSKCLYGNKGPYAGGDRKFIVDWIICTLSLLFLALGVIHYATSNALLKNHRIVHDKFSHMSHVQSGMLWCHYALYIILTADLAVATFTFNRTLVGLGRYDTVTHAILVWVLPALLFHALYILVESVLYEIKGNLGWNDTKPFFLAIPSSFVGGACVVFALIGFIRTLTAPDGWKQPPSQIQ